jgi:hypothetical protein
VGVGYYVYWDGQHYLKTDNARVTATLYTVTPPPAASWTG